MSESRNCILSQKVPAATVDPFYSTKLEAAERGTANMQMESGQQANSPANSAHPAEDDSAVSLPQPPAATEAAAGPASVPAALASAPAATPSPPARVHHWPVRAAKPAKGVMKRESPKAFSSARIQPPALLSPGMLSTLESLEALHLHTITALACSCAFYMHVPVWMRQNCLHPHLLP